MKREVRDYTATIVVRHKVRADSIKNAEIIADNYAKFIRGTLDGIEETKA